jgi:RNA polymerase sigma-70 factor, ECF subfamily
MNAIALDTRGSRFIRRAPARWSATVRIPELAMTTGSGEAPGARMARLVQAVALRGERDAFAALFEHFAPRVKSYLLRLGASPELAEEIAQETLLTVWRRAAAFDPARAAASTWIFTIARNLRIDAARRANRPTALEDPSDAVPAPLPPDAVFAAVQDETRVGAAIATLSEEQSQVIRLAFFSDKPHSEIARELALPLGTVKSRLRLAMARLRILLGEGS